MLEWFKWVTILKDKQNRAANTLSIMYGVKKCYFPDREILFMKLSIVDLNKNECSEVLGSEAGDEFW